MYDIVYDKDADMALVKGLPPHQSLQPHKDVAT